MKYTIGFNEITPPRPKEKDNIYPDWGTYELLKGPFQYSLNV